MTPLIGLRDLADTLTRRFVLSDALARAGGGR